MQFSDEDVPSIFFKPQLHEHVVICQTSVNPIKFGWETSKDLHPVAAITDVMSRHRSMVHPKVAIEAILLMDTLLALNSVMPKANAPLLDPEKDFLTIGPFAVRNQMLADRRRLFYAQALVDHIGDLDRVQTEQEKALYEQATKDLAAEVKIRNGFMNAFRAQQQKERS